MNPESLRRLQEAIRRRGERPPAEQFDEMVRDGVIDRDGNVLIRMPEIPEFLRRPDVRRDDDGAGEAAQP